MIVDSMAAWKKNVHPDQRALFSNLTEPNYVTKQMYFSKTCLKRPFKKTENWFSRPIIA